MTNFILHLFYVIFNYESFACFIRFFKKAVFVCLIAEMTEIYFLTFLEARSVISKCQLSFL